MFVLYVERVFIYCILYKKTLIYKANFNLKLPQFIWNSHALFCQNIIKMGDVPSSLWELSLRAVPWNQLKSESIETLYILSALKTPLSMYKKACSVLRRIGFKYIVIQLFCSNLWTTWTKYFTEPIMKSKLKSQFPR